MLQNLKRLVRHIGREDRVCATAQSATPAARPDNESYWTGHNVTNHRQFASVEQSLAYIDWRNDQYPDYIEMLPVSGHDGKTVLDYGCGPGNDLIGFGHYSRPSKLIGMDISSSSLGESKARLAMHGIAADLHHIREADQRLPLSDASIDYVHSSGVVQCTEDPAKVLREFRRVIRPTGTCRIMVYNYQSLWLHLYVAYVKCIKEGLYAGMDIRTAFSNTTDGPDCPISRAYKPEEFCHLAADCGFRGRFLGAAMSLIELGMLPLRFEATQRLELPAEHRKFLLALTLDARGFPLHEGHYAGIVGCFELAPM